MDQMLDSEEKFGEGDTFLVPDVLPDDLASSIFDALRQEVKWNTMSHRGGEVPRRVAVEGLVEEDGSFPVYRHPADEAPPLLPFSPTVNRIRLHVEQVLKQPLNHVLIQHYRHGGDYISEHSDKTIDVVRGSRIVNVSIGAQRVMTLRTKKDALSETPDGSSSRSIQRIPLPHNSMFVLGSSTNAKWLHGIRTDKRPTQTKSPAEQAWGGERISLTFRSIGTFLTADQKRIFGQGAKGKTKEGAKDVVIGGPEAEKMIIAFGDENHKSDFDWNAAYGEGFDVLHFAAATT